MHTVGVIFALLNKAMVAGESRLGRVQKLDRIILVCTEFFSLLYLIAI